MAGNDLIKKQIKICLSCRKGQKIIRDYKTIYKMHIEKYISSSNIELVETIRKVLEYGDVCEGEKTLEELKKNYNRNEDIKDLIDDTKAELKGLKNRNVSIRLLKYDFEESEKQAVEDLAGVLNIEGSLIEKYEKLTKLSSGNLLEKDTTDCFKNLSVIIHAIKPLYKDDTGILDSKLRHEIDVIRAMNDRNKQLGDLYQECDVREDWGYLGKSEREDTKKKIGYIFEQFCSGAFTKYEIENDRNCDCQLFLEFVKNIDKTQVEKRNEIYNRINNLPEINQEIICNYLFNAPKKFGSNLQRIMLEQDMSERFISSITNIGASTIQSLQKCAVPSFKQGQSDKLRKVLLVSEDVLKTGVGKRYGNWKDFLDEECIKGLQESSDLSDVNTKSEANEYVKNQIKGFVEMDNARFDEFLKKNEEYLYGEDCVLYETEWECFEALLNQDEFYTLLEVLERQS